MVGLSKHLCGVATDLTLRCLRNSCYSDAAAPTNVPPTATAATAAGAGYGGCDGGKLKLHGVAIALCCHHGQYSVCVRVRLRVSFARLLCLSLVML